MPHETEALIDEMRGILEGAHEDELTARRGKCRDLHQRISALLHSNLHEEDFVVKGWRNNKNSDQRFIQR